MIGRFPAHLCLLVTAVGLALAVRVGAAAALPQPSAAGTVEGGAQTPSQQSAPIPFDQIGAAAGKQYSGDGLAVRATSDGARLSAVFQKLEAEATRDGLWLTSTAPGEGGRLRLLARGVG